MSPLSWLKNAKVSNIRLPSLAVLNKPASGSEQTPHEQRKNAKLFISENNFPRFLHSQERLHIHLIKREFMIFARLLTIGLLFSFVSNGAAWGQQVKTKFEQLAAQEKAQPEMVQLWQKHPFQTLSTIDSYLEGSLKLVESSETPDQAAIKQMHTTAIRGAAAADRAFGTIIFSEYTSAFAGWNGAQQKQFRAGQKAFRDAQAALKTGQFETALSAGQSCVDKATPLGDWWGMAMGYSAVGQANKALGKNEASLTAYTQSRSINHQLRLGRAELASTLAMVELLQQMNQPTRARVTCQQGIALAEQLGDAASAAKLKKMLK